MNFTSSRFVGLAALLVSVLTLGACASGPQVMVHAVSKQTYTPTSLVQVLYKYPPQPYQTIASMSVQGIDGQTVAQLLAALQAKAASLGADAIVVKISSANVPPGLNYSPAGGQFTTSSGASIPTVKADAIRYTRQ